MIEILDFINSLRETDQYIKSIYTKGGCYQFALLLHKMYPCSTILVNYDNTHAVLKYNRNLYDIRGLVRKKRDFHIPSEDEIKEMEKWSFSRNYMLKLGEYPVYFKDGELVLGEPV